MTLLYIFDMDDVLYDYDWRTRMAGMTALTGLSLQKQRDLWWNDDGEWAAEAGAFTTAAEYLAAFEAAIEACSRWGAHAKVAQLQRTLQMSLDAAAA